MCDSDPEEPPDSKAVDDLFRFQAAADESLSTSIIRGIATLDDVEPESVDPLYSVIDPDALDALFKPGFSGRPRVEFQYNGCEVKVTGDRKIEIRTTGDEA